MARGALGVAGELIGSRYGQGAANTTTQLGGAAAQGLFLLPNSRTQESETDVVGQRLLAQAGFDTRPAVNLWTNMLGAGARRPAAWRSTHPIPQTRIRALDQPARCILPPSTKHNHNRHTKRGTL